MTIRQSSNMQAAIRVLHSYDTEEERTCFAHGYNSAHGIVCHNTPNMHTVVRLPDEIHPITVTPENFLDVVQQLALAAEEHSRCFSPWEQVAAYINDLPGDDPLHYWNIYDEGVHLAIQHDMEGLENGVH